MRKWLSVWLAVQLMGQQRNSDCGNKSAYQSASVYYSRLVQTNLHSIPPSSRCNNRPNWTAETTAKALYTAIREYTMHSKLDTDMSSAAVRDPDPPVIFSYSNCKNTAVVGKSRQQEEIWDDLIIYWLNTRWYHSFWLSLLDISCVVLFLLLVCTLQCVCGTVYVCTVYRLPCTGTGTRYPVPGTVVQVR